MAQRTTISAVQTVLGANYGALPDGTDPSLQPYIDHATVVVDRVVECATAKGITITTAQALQMETWLGGYYYTRMDPQYKSRTTKDASGAWAVEGKEYAQAAMDVDPSGCLAGIINGKGARAEMYWLGKPRSEQIDYVDRD